MPGAADRRSVVPPRRRVLELTLQCLAKRCCHAPGCFYIAGALLGGIIADIGADCKGCSVFFAVSLANVGEIISATSKETTAESAAVLFPLPRTRSERFQSEIILF